MATQRLVSLDAFRGATIASMILVNNPGGPTAYAPLEHAEWSGWTPTDLIFPFFLWITGVAMTFSFASRVERGANRGALLAHALRRAGWIFLTGLLLNGFPYYHLATIRIPGVLQRIAICYAIAAALYLYTHLRGRLAAIVILLAAYTVMMHPGGYDKGTNFAARVDSLLLSGHMWSATKTWDPEGIVSTLPAIVTTLLGVLTGELLRTSRTGVEKARWMWISGTVLVVSGQTFNVWQPINKALWTVSFSLFTAGMALLLFGLFYWVVDVHGWKRWTYPFTVFGMNAMAAYVLAGVLDRALDIRRLHEPIYQAIFAPLASPLNASLLWALAFVLTIYLCCWFLYRRGWFLRF